MGYEIDGTTVILLSNFMLNNFMEINSILFGISEKRMNKYTQVVEQLLIWRLIDLIWWSNRFMAILNEWG